VPQLGHVTARGEAHSWQNFAPTLFCVPQLGQFNFRRILIGAILSPEGAHPSRTQQQRFGMSKHSKSERERRTQESEAVARIQAAWQASVPAASAKEFEKAVEAARARARDPNERAPDMAKGTLPNPPRPGREPKPKKDPNRTKKRY
jgi:hypothetical protein